jgi:hypothetical protein
MRVMRYVCLTTLVFCVMAGAMAQGRRSFAASYKLGNVTESGNDVRVTINLNLRNFGADVSNGMVVLLSSEANPNPLGMFSAINILHRSQLVTQSETFTIPKAEYLLWVAGRDPVLRFVLDDPNGVIRAEHIDLQRITPGVGATK